jgi:hypothetical protein
MDDINNETVSVKKNIFDDSYYPNYRETTKYIEKDKLFETIVKDLLEYLTTCIIDNEMRVGYIIYSKCELSSSKMNNMLNLLVQSINPNIYTQSLWEIFESCKGPMQTSKGLEIIEINKIKIKIIVKPNNKDIAIKKLAEINLNYLKKNKKVNKYLQ